MNYIDLLLSSFWVESVVLLVFVALHESISQCLSYRHCISALQCAISADMLFKMGL